MTSNRCAFSAIQTYRFQNGVTKDVNATRLERNTDRLLVLTVVETAATPKQLRQQVLTRVQSIIPGTSVLWEFQFLSQLTSRDKTQQVSLTFQRHLFTLTAETCD